MGKPKGMDRILKEMTTKYKDMVWDINKRDSKRINRISKLIGKIWRKNPDLRLCQILGSCFQAQDLYYVEDDLLEERLREVYLAEEIN